MAKKTYKITGNTFGRKDKLRNAGAKWNAADKTWTAELFGSDAIFKWSDLVFTEFEETSKNFNDVINEGQEGFQSNNW